MADEEERPKIDKDLKKELLESKKTQKDVSERAKELEGKIPTAPKED